MDQVDDVAHHVDAAVIAGQQVAGLGRGVAELVPDAAEHVDDAAAAQYKELLEHRVRFRLDQLVVLHGVYAPAVLDDGAQVVGVHVLYYFERHVCVGVVDERVVRQHDDEQLLGVQGDELYGLGFQDARKLSVRHEDRRDVLVHLEDLDERTVPRVYRFVGGLLRLHLGHLL